MDTVTLCRCSRCHLEWRQDERSSECPRCRKSFSTPQVVIAGVEVAVEAVVLRGDEMGLHDPKVRRGLEHLWVGERCKCGLLTWRICPKCNRK